MVSPLARTSYERIGSASLLRITRPERRNAVDLETAAELEAGFERFEADGEARVLVLSGDEQAFCAGADLKAVAELGPEAGEEAITDLVERPGGPMGFTRLTPSKPTIAAVSGWCLAGGLELALWCDLRIAAPGAQIGYPERRWGVPLIDGGTVRLPRIIGMGRALELILTGKIIDAEAAHGWGLVNEVADDPLVRALALAEELAGFPQQTMLSDRRSALEGEGLPLDEALANEMRLGRDSVRTGIAGAGRFAGGEGRGGAGVERS